MHVRSGAMAIAPPPSSSSVCVSLSFGAFGVLGAPIAIDADPSSTSKYSGGACGGDMVSDGGSVRRSYDALPRQK